MALTIPTGPGTAAADRRDLRDALRRDPRARRIAQSWRRLTEAQRTLVACSAGADSTALLLALWAAEPEAVVVGHVVHDMRGRAEALEDRDAAAAAADRLGVPFVQADIRIAPGNVEAEARRARHAALARLAREAAAPFVAMGHHAGDQLETVLMRLIRGAGPRGLGAMPDRRRLDRQRPRVDLVRPMLAQERDDAEAICRLGGVAWREDATNQDLSRLRAALRHGAASALASARPGALRRASESADLLRDAAAVVEDRAAEVFGGESAWPRAALRSERPIVIGAGLRRAIARRRGGTGRDRLARRRLVCVIEAIRDDREDERIFDLVGGGRIVVGARLVRLEEAGP